MDNSDLAESESELVSESEESESESEEEEDSASSIARRCSMISFGAFCSTIHEADIKDMIDRKTNLKVLSHFFRDNTQPNTSKVVDRKPSVLRHIHWEHSRTTPLHLWIFEPLREHLQSHAFHHLLHENFDEDTTARSGVVFIDFDALKGHPRNGVRAKQMSKKAGDVAQPIGFIPMNGGVVICEC